MITFDKGNSRFNFRTAGVIQHDDKVLIHQAEGDDFWALPGGRVEMGESSETAIVREMEEEIGLHFRVTRPLWFLENFFDHQEKEYHEISVIFLIHCITEEELLARGNKFTGLDSGTPLLFEWHKVETLVHFPLFPTFLRTELGELPSSEQYRVHTDREQTG